MRVCTIRLHICIHTIKGPPRAVWMLCAPGTIITLLHNPGNPSPMGAARGTIISCAGNGQDQGGQRPPISHCPSKRQPRRRKAGSPYLCVRCPKPYYTTTICTTIIIMTSSSKSKSPFVKIEITTCRMTAGPESLIVNVA